MNTKLLLEYADLLLVVGCISVFSIIWQRRRFSEFKAFGLYLISLMLLDSIQVPILFFRRYLGVNKDFAYNVLFYSTEFMACIQTILFVVAIYSVFQTAMKPFKGIQRMGALIFKWVAGVCLMLGVVIALGPHVFASGSSFTVAVTTVVERAQEGVNVLTLCLLLFVCIAIKPLGLTLRSSVFGVSLGLGIISTVELVQSAWFWTAQAHSVYSPVYLFGTVGYLVALTIWGTYFALPEPARKLIVLPTTSPFFHWNRISEALGDAPGNVAIGFNASMISPIETKMMTAMSKGARNRAAIALAHAEADMDTLAAS